MSKISELFAHPPHVVNFGIEAFQQDLLAQKKPAIHVDWKPAAGGDKVLAAALKTMTAGPLAEKITAANAQGLRRILEAKPTLVGLGLAGDLIPGMTPTTILHAGPPITWQRMCQPMKGAVMGGLIYEGLAENLTQAEQLAQSGRVTFSPCHLHSTVGPMAGVVTASMPVWRVVNKTFGNEAYCTLNEGLGRVLRFGACDGEVIERLRWMAKTLYPTLQAVLALRGEIDLQTIIAQGLQMGDEAHNRNKACTSLLLRELAPAILAAEVPQEDKVAALAFLNGNDHTFLNLSMPACKCTMDTIVGIPYCTLLSTMSRNGTDFGIRIAGLGTEAWFTAPAEAVEGLFFPGYSREDANPDLGDSCITETAGIGGFCMAAAPAIVQFVGGKVADAVCDSLKMYEITAGESAAYKIPTLDFRGAPTGIDLRRVLETGIRPIINTGIAHKDYGVGQVGAGIVSPPEECFAAALRACAQAWGGQSIPSTI